MAPAKNRCQRFIRRWWGTILSLTLILWLTLAPKPVGNHHFHLFVGADKCVHAFLFALLGFAFIAERGAGRTIARNVALTAFGAIACLGAVIEIAQEMMGLGRTFEWADIMADASGAAAGIAISYYVNNHKAKYARHKK